MAEDTPSVSYEDLAAIEEEFEDIDMEILRKQYGLSKNAYAKRAAVVAKIPFFWPLVFEQAPLEIDQYVQPQDSRIFAESLIKFEVRRPELDVDGAGSPRSLQVRFEFQPNEDFDNTVLEKTFWYRRAKDGWVGLVSEPVKINWKSGKDLTQGLTDMTRALFEARTKMGDMTAEGLPEYTSLKKRVESWNGLNTSFFTWFGWVSSRRWVSKEESDEATREYVSAKAQRKEGNKVDASKGDTTEEDEEVDDEAVEVHQAGEDLAIALAEDLWPNAIKYFTQAQEVNDMEGSLDSMSEEDEADDGPVDIRSLVQEGRSRASNNEAPAAKRQKR